MRIAIDAMGGDNAPQAIVEGTLQAARANRDVTLVLVGDEEAIQRCLGSERPPNIEIVHTTEVITADDEPVRSVRRKKDSSMVVAARMVKEGQADGFVSAGNTGALMTAGLLVVGRIPSIERPALASIWPTFCGKAMLVLDVGANMDAEPLHLFQYGLMANAFAKELFDLKKPRIGLLNIGSEPGKGDKLRKEAFELLQNGSFDFVGNIEAREAMYDKCDVLVADGFTGNNMLKLIEGFGLGLFDRLRDVFMAGTLTKLAAFVLKPGLRKFKKTFDYSEYGGAPLLGINGAVIKAHGSSNARAFEMAIEQARRFIAGGVLEQIRSDLEVQQQ
ncbi:phosphate acyltransferase PlsX [Tumebacillus permanentifrigoris]|uniref:Phosphate acyltransferase n=1 Tax=Tumebacillus permanentifrigoris TaxID=378543 RepID=A0A316DUM4_9BACL|nr:phosphate acyltransferase PlsX [Tumebacillus permanentifrigoris]PWK12772.1 phosphate:acyl-[acyl carrier protein] acyltransferase [Tumebacillus permanentifrigoris]